MATLWPSPMVWRTDLREHADQLSEYLQKLLTSVDSAQGSQVPALVVRDVIQTTQLLIEKQRLANDFRPIAHKLHTTSAAITAQGAILQQIQDRLDNMRNSTNTALHQEISEVKKIASTANTTAETTQQILLSQIQEELGEIKEAAVTARAAAESAARTSEKIKERTYNSGNAPSYAAAAAAGRGTGVNRLNPQNIQLKTTLSTQAQREIIVNIRDANTVARIRATNPQNLKTLIDRAIGNSNNEHIRAIKVASSNQLKSGDLSIKAMTVADATKLKQFADDWTHGIGSGATARVDTFGVIAHGIRTSTMEMDRPEQVIRDILQDNKPFIPNAEIRHVGWLTRAAMTKAMSSIIIEFKNPRDANRIIDEGLIWKAEALQCELYDRQCRLKQCYKCQRYGHIGTQCKATETCGYCAQEHSSQDCPIKANRAAPRKCAMCQDPHEAWSRQCKVREGEIAKLKSAYDTRPRYHPEPTIQEDRGRNQSRSQVRIQDEPRDRAAGTQDRSRPEAEWTTVTRRPRGRPRKNPLPDQTAGEKSRSRSRAKRPRRGLADDTNNSADEEDDAMENGARRSARMTVPSRRATESGRNGMQTSITDTEA
jgi:hypothetical protein